MADPDSRSAGNVARHVPSPAMLPPGTFLFGFDESLTVVSVESSSGPDYAGLVGQPLERMIGAADPDEVQQAARDALAGAVRTLAVGTAGGGPDVLVRMGPDPSGMGAALVFDFDPEAVLESGARDHSTELESIATVTRALARSTYADEARLAICEAAHLVTQAPRIVLFETDGTGHSLHATSSLGVDAATAALPLNESSGAAMALRMNASRFVSAAAHEPEGALAFLAEARIRSVLWQPVSRGRTVRGVLAIGWDEPLDQVAPSVIRLSELVGVEAAVALDRGSALERLVAMAKTDVLTGLPNRRAWEHELDRELSRAAREGSEVSVAMLDLDGFKELNDTRGHPAGDRILEAIAEEWRALTRASDLLARYGGDEFALTLPQCGADEAMQMLERLRDHAETRVSFSAGAATWDGREAGSELIRRADQALYEAKESARGSIRIAS